MPITVSPDGPPDHDLGVMIYRRSAYPPNAERDAGRAQLPSKGNEDSVALTMEGGAEVTGVDYGTIKLILGSETSPAIQLGPRRMIPRAGLLCVIEINPCSHQAPTVLIERCAQ